jgi:hypothetical protein
MTTETTNKRRTFLLGATLGSAGAVAAVVANSGVKDLAVAAGVVAEKKPKGYHMTAHIQQYYDTTRI